MASQSCRDTTNVILNRSSSFLCLTLGEKMIDDQGLVGKLSRLTDPVGTVWDFWGSSGPFGLGKARGGRDTPLCLLSSWETMTGL